MSEETKTIESQNGAAVSTEPTFKRFDYGDLTMTCSHCGHSEVVEKGIKDGLQFVLPTTDEHKLRLVCSKCGISLEMTFQESDEETKKEAEAKYEAWLAEQEAAKAKAEDVIDEAKDTIEATDNAVLQEDTKEESTPGDN